MGHHLPDLRIALRGLRRRPGFTALATATLALGIATTTVVFSFVYAILLRPFPFPDPERLVRIETVHAGSGAERGCALLDVEDTRREATTLEAVGAYYVGTSQLQGDGAARAVETAWVEAGALAAIGVEPMLGRLFTPEEDRPGGDVDRILLGHALWRERYGGDPAILGRTIHSPITSYTVAGVMPPGFDFPGRAEVWVPMESWYAAQSGERAEKKRGQFWYQTLARLAPGVSPAAAAAELDAVAGRLAERFPDANAEIGLRLTPLREREVGALRPYLALLAGGAVLLLLIGCTNVAGLLLVHAAARERDLAIRAALGAGRGRLVRVLLGEAALLSALGALPAVGLTYAGVAALRRLIPVPLPAWMRIEVDATVLAASLGIATLTALLAGAVPAWLTSRADPRAVLAEGARSASGRSRLRAGLIVGEVALSLLLLVGAGLLMRTFLALAEVDPGFRRHGLLVVQVARYQPGENREERAGALARFHDQVLSRLEALPGIEGAAATNSLPFVGTDAGRQQADLTVRGATAEELERVSPLEGADVTPEYFAVMGIPIVQGRGFASTDTAESPCVVLVDEDGARELWPGRDPLGQEVLWGEPSPGNPYCRVVGVAGDVKHHPAETAGGIELYYSFRQWPVTNPYYVLRVAGDPAAPLAAIGPAVRRAIQEVDADTAVVFVKTMDQRFDESLWQRRLWGVAMAVFALLALVLAAVGLYGGVSYAVTQRTRELGIRMALGARPRRILMLVVAEGLKPVLAGAALGVAGALAASEVLAGLLFGVRPLDAATYLEVTLLLTATALVACAIPARRAARVDPLAALRQE